MDAIHPAAVVDAQTNIDSSVEIGPLCVVESNVTIQKGCRLLSHSVVKSGTTLGPDNTVCEGAVLGGAPQHLHAGEQIGRLSIGSGNVIRENATIHCALDPKNCTVVGDNNLIMVNAHIAHDCKVGDHTIITNNAMIAGHVTIENRAYVSGAAGIHQFCRIGQLAMVGGQAHLRKDVPPFMMIDGFASRVVGLNLIGLRRAGFSSEDIGQLKSAYRVIYRSNLAWNEMLAELKREFTSGPAACYFEFLRTATRGIMQERRGPVQSTLRLFRGNEDEDQREALSARSAS